MSLADLAVALPLPRIQPALPFPLLLSPPCLFLLPDAFEPHLVVEQQLDLRCSRRDFQGLVSRVAGVVGPVGPTGYGAQLLLEPLELRLPAGNLLATVSSGLSGVVGNRADVSVQSPLREEAAHPAANGNDLRIKFGDEAQFLFQ